MGRADHPPGPGTRLHLCTGTEDARCEGSLRETGQKPPGITSAGLTLTSRERCQRLHMQPRLETPLLRASLLCVSMGQGSAASAPSIHPTPASGWAPQHGALPPVTVRGGEPRAAQSHLWLKFCFNFGSGPSKLQSRLATFTVCQMLTLPNEADRHWSFCDPDASVLNNMFTAEK